MNPEWGLNEYRICKAQNGYIISGSEINSVKPDLKMKVFSNLRTALIWLCREYKQGELMKELAHNGFLKNKK